MSKSQLLIQIAEKHEDLAKLFRALADKSSPDNSAYQSPTIRKESSNSQNGGQYKEFDATQLIKTFDDDGNPRIKIKGRPFEKFGVPVYEEDFSILGIDVEELNPGAHPFNHRVKAILKDDGNPRKIVEVLG